MKLFQKPATQCSWPQILPCNGTTVYVLQNMVILNWRTFFVLYRVEFLCILAFAFVVTLIHLSFACEDPLDWKVLTSKPSPVPSDDLCLVEMFVGQGRNKSNPVCTSIFVHRNAFLVKEAVRSYNCYSFTFLFKHACLICYLLHE